MAEGKGGGETCVWHRLYDKAGQAFGNGWERMGCHRPAKRGRERIVSAPPLSYLICALPRSGSSVVCDALGTTELAGRPREYFQPEAIPKWL